MWSQVLGKEMNLEIDYQELSEKVAPVGLSNLDQVFLFKDVSQS